MNTDFWVGFAWGFLTAVVLACYIFSFAPKKPKGKEKIDYCVEKSVIHEKHLHPAKVSVEVEFPQEHFATFSSDAYKRGVINDALKLKMIDKLWEFVNVEKIDNPTWCTYQYRANVLVLLPAAQALKNEMEQKNLTTL